MHDNRKWDYHTIWTLSLLNWTNFNQSHWGQDLILKVSDNIFQTTECNYEEILLSMIHKIEACQEQKCTLWNSEIILCVFALSPDFPHETNFLCHTQLFEAITVTKLDIIRFQYCPLYHFSFTLHWFILWFCSR